MTKKYSFLLGLVLVIFLTDFANGAITAKSKITDVTLYSDRALITRTYSFDAIKGEKDIAFSNLPLYLDKGSVRVEVVGDIKIDDVKTSSVYEDAKENPQIKIIENKIRATKLKLSETDYKKSNLYKQKELLMQSFKLKNIDDVSREVREGSVNTVEWQKLVDFYLNNLNRIEKTMAQLADKAIDLRDKLNDLNNELNKYRYANVRGTTNITVGVDVLKTSKATIKVSYIMKGASWRPSYDVRATGGDKVELVYYGKVRQSTTEDWNNVRLTLSSAAPQMSATPPRLTPWVLDVREPVEYKRESLRAKKAFNVGIMAKESEMADSLAFAPDAPVYSKNMTSTEFTIKKKATVLANSEEETVTILRESLPSKLTYEIVPKRGEHAYLKANVENTLEYPLLAGSARVFINDSFIGRATMEEKLPGEELEMPLGVDQGVKVSRKLLKKVTGDKGITSSKVRIEYSFEIEIENLKGEKIKAILLDQLPISRSGDVKVKLTNVSVKPDEENERKEKGEMQWIINIAPKEKFLLNYSFYIEYPKGKNVIGL